MSVSSRNFKRKNLLTHFFQIFIWIFLNMPSQDDKWLCSKTDFVNYWSVYPYKLTANISFIFISFQFAAAKSLQSCLTLCDPTDGSPPGSPSLGFSRQEHWSGLPFPSLMHESEKCKWSRSVVSDLSDPMDLVLTEGLERIILRYIKTRASFCSGLYSQCS